MMLRGIFISFLAGSTAFCQDNVSTNLDGFTIKPVEVISSRTVSKAPALLKPDQETPQKAALSYLNYLKYDKDIPAELMVPTQYVKRARQEEIKKEQGQLAILASNLFALCTGKKNSPEISLIDTKIDGDLAVVTFRVYNKDVLLNFLGSSLALVKRDGLWKVAPLTSSFENAGLPFDDAVRAKAAKLTEGINMQITNALLAEKQDLHTDLARKALEIRNASKGKTVEELLTTLIDAMHRRDAITIAALVENEGSKANSKRSSTGNAAETPDDELARMKNWLADVIKSMGMSSSTNSKMSYAFNAPSIDLASDACNIIVPFDVGEKDKEPREGMPSVSADADCALGVVVLNFLPDYQWRQDMKSFNSFTGSIALVKPADTSKSPCFGARLGNSFPYGNQDPLGTENDIQKKMCANFTKYFPPYEWKQPEEAARAILSYSVKGDINSLLRSVNPELFASGDNAVFMTAAEFMKNLIMSTQLPFPELPERINNSNVRSGMNSSTLFVLNPSTPDVTNARVYIKPDGKEAIVLADAPESRNSGASKISFKINQMENGNWVLKIFPGPFPALGENTERKTYTLFKNRGTTKNAPTIFMGDPDVQHCREDFVIMAQQDEAGRAPLSP